MVWGEWVERASVNDRKAKVKLCVGLGLAPGSFALMDWDRLYGSMPRTTRGTGGVPRPWRVVG